MFRQSRRQTRLTPQQEQLLRSTTIGERRPGSLLRDFEALLNFIEETSPQLTGMNLLTMRALNAFNPLLTRPIQHGLSRPQQKLFPPINGLFWLVRAVGLTQVDATGKKPVLLVDQGARRSWQALNPTERYCILLETWLLRAQPEILGEWSRFGFNNVIENWHRLFRLIPDEGVAVAGNADIEQWLNYYPDYLNLALLELFGLVELQPAPPVEGKGWSVATARRTPLGDALLVLVTTTLYGDSLERPGVLFQFHRASEVPMGVLQPIFQPYFPAWQHNLTLPEQTVQEGLYVFKVELWKGLWRRISIPAQATLDELADTILHAYRFDKDHLYRFIYPNRFGGQDEVNCPYMDEGPYTDQVTIGELPLRVGQTMVYNFDFGDNWEFQVTLEQIDPTNRRQKKARIIEREGKAPEQYPRWDDD